VNGIHFNQSQSCKSINEHIFKILITLPTKKPNQKERKKSLEFFACEHFNQNLVDAPGQFLKINILKFWINWKYFITLTPLVEPNYLWPKTPQREINRSLQQHNQILPF
jgi:hypothetical protein